MQEDKVISHSIAMTLLNDLSTFKADSDVQNRQEKLIKEVMGAAYAGEVYT